MQKVVTVRCTAGSEGTEEMEFDKVNKYLSEGYKVKQIHQASPNNQSTTTRVFITFVLEKIDASGFIG